MGKPLNLGIMRALNQVISRSGLARTMGQRFGGLRDYYEVFGYKKNLVYDDLLIKYIRQGLASRIVDAPAQALWDNPPLITSNNDEWNAAWARMVTKHAMWEAILRLDKLAGLGRYSCLLIGTNAPQSIDKPPRSVSNEGKLRELLYFQAYSQKTAEIKTINGDTSSSQYLLPETYTLYPFRQDDVGLMTKIEGSMPATIAHYSRILHIAENTLENQVYGTPRLERVFNDLDDMLKVSGGTAETYWTTSNRGMQVDIDKDMELTAADAEDLSEELDEYVHQMRRVIRTRGVKINNLGSDIPKPEETFNMLISLISGATGIPRRILIGAEAGQLASEQDRANWAERIVSRRKHFAEPVVIYPLISKLTNLGILPSGEDITVTVTWPDAYQLNPLELAQKAAQHARSMTNFAAGIDKLVKLKKGTPGIPAQLDAEGKEIPGTVIEAEEGEDYTEIINLPWIKELLGQEPEQPQLDDPGDFTES